MRQRVLIIAILLAASWYAMMLVHECGHVIAAWSTGSHVEAVRVPWLGFSQTIVPTTDWPRVVAASGAALGSALPFLAWLTIRCMPRIRRGTACAIARYFAGFCLLANGVYVGCAVLLPVGDTEDLVRMGVPAWTLTVIGWPIAAAGVAMWNGMAKSIGTRARIDGEIVGITLMDAVTCMVCVLALVGLVNLVQ
ncbi:MAG: hypothetical protein IT434_03735 [Phycisphaerales bacterium]|jgi:hypothetical protein|nr:hypothetical protein [Phycisphaerales bacterium]